MWTFNRHFLYSNLHSTKFLFYICYYRLWELSYMMLWIIDIYMIMYNIREPLFNNGLYDVYRKMWSLFVSISKNICNDTILKVNFIFLGSLQIYTSKYINLSLSLPIVVLKEREWCINQTAWSAACYQILKLSYKSEPFGDFNFVGVNVDETDIIITFCWEKWHTYYILFL